MYRVKNNRWKYLAALLLAIVVLTAGCGKAASAPAAEQASEDMTEAARTADTVAEEAAEEEEKITPENALVGLCFARSETGDNEYRSICEVATSKLARKTHIDMLNKVQINYYAAGLHRPGSEAVFRYTGMELRDRYELIRAAFGL